MSLSVREKKNKNGRKSSVAEVEFPLPTVWECLTEKVQRSKGSEGRGDTENPEECSRHTAHYTKCKCPEAEMYSVPELQYGAETIKR